MEINRSIRGLDSTRDAMVAQTRSNSNSSRLACCVVLPGADGRKLVLLDLPGDESSETKAGPISAVAKKSSKISTSDAIAMIPLGAKANGC